MLSATGNILPGHTQRVEASLLWRALTYLLTRPWPRGSAQLHSINNHCCACNSLPHSELCDEILSSTAKPTQLLPDFSAELQTRQPCTSDLVDPRRERQGVNSCDYLCAVAVGSLLGIVPFSLSLSVRVNLVMKVPRAS